MPEYAPIFTEDPDDDSETGSDRKKRRKSIFEAPAEAKKPPEEDTDEVRAERKRGFLSLVDPEEETRKEEARDEAPETEPVSEAEAPTDVIGETEKPVVEQQLVPLLRQQNAEAAPDPDTDPPAERFLELVESGIGSDAAAQEVMAELGVTESEDTGPAAEAVETELGSTQGLGSEELLFDRTAEAAPEDQPLGTATVPAAGPSQARRPGSLPPRGPDGFGPPSGPEDTRPDFAPPPPAAPAGRERVEYYDRANPAAMALFGGIIGYLIGRRRGRIKTEKRLLPIQKKLEKQVTNLSFELQEKEKKIRRLAAAKVSREGPAVLEAFKKPIIEKPPVARREAPEATLLHTPEAPEHLGHVMMAAESKPAARPETRPAQADKTPELAAGDLTDHRIETLNRADLLALSEKIVVEGSSLRRIYETHLVGERGLRRLVIEHLHGGDLKKALNREIVEREIDFERDPAMRDMAPAGSTGGGAAARPARPPSLDEMLAKATAEVGDNSEEAAFYKARANYDAEQYRQQQKQRRVVDVTLTVVILTLLGLVLWLWVGRG